MSNIGRIFDELSSEDYLCPKLRPRDFEQLVCSHCSGEIKPEEAFADYCPHCQEFLNVIEV